MNARNKHEQPALREVETCELRAIPGGSSGFGPPGNLQTTSVIQQNLIRIEQLLQSELVPNHGSHGFK